MSQDIQPTNSEKLLGGRYKIISQLGSGGFGQTFLAEDLHLPGNPRCVVKQLLLHTSDAETLAMARRLFDTEAKVLYQLGDHDQIPRLLAHFEENQEFYLAQECIEGEPLTKELVKGEPWEEARVIDLLQDILQVLAFVHEQQVIHRDLKPPNMIRRHCDGKIVLIDFGAVKQVSSQVINPETGETNLTISIGTKGYMPNEQLAGIPRFSSDVYAVGMLAIQALAGVHPKRLGEDPQTSEIDWHQHAPHLSPELAQIIDKMVRYDFRDRYTTAAQALEAIQSLIDSRPESVAPKKPPSEEREEPPQELEPSPSKPEPKSEMELESTNIWVTTDSPVQTAVGSMDPTAPLSQQEPPLQSSETRVPASSTLTSIQRQIVKFWPLLAVFAAVGTTFAVTKTLLSSQFLSQVNGSGAPTEKPTPTPTGVSSPKPQPPPKPKAEDLMKQAERLRQAGQYEKARQLYDQVIKMKPKLAEAYWGRCYSLNKLKKPAEAVVACNDALDLKPNYPEALWIKADAYYQQKLTIEALEIYRVASRRKRDFAEGWLSYGVALQSVGRSSEALWALDKAIDLKRDIAKAWSTKGEALWNLGRLDEAIAALDKSLQLQPNQPKVLELRKKIQKELGR
jgi:serine/threonine protein kinase